MVVSYILVRVEGGNVERLPLPDEYLL